MKNGLKAAVVGVWLAASAVVAHAADAPMTLNIAAQPVGDALNELARQTGLQVVLYTDVGEGIRAPSLQGEFTPESALKRLLGNSGLTYKFLDARTVAVSDPGKARIEPVSSMQHATLHLAQASTADSTPGAAERASTGNSSRAAERNSNTQANTQEIVVTGTNIRGVDSPASPVYRFDRQDITESGIGTTEQFLQSLPQNFGGGNSASTMGGTLGGEDSNWNYAQGTGVNLRGLGNDSTLVLVNGRRVAPAGIGNFVDISLIPISAVERMDVLADGASAIYGSDAVAGVVNIQLRRDFQGAESRARYASVTSGDYDEKQIGQLLGTSWSSGSAMLTYEYFDRSALDTNDRFATRSYSDTSHLMPEEQRHSSIASLEQRFSERVNGFANASFSRRKNRSLFNGGVTQTDTTSTSEQYGATGGASFDFSNGWRAEMAGAYSTNNNVYFVTYPGLAYTLEQNSDVWSVDAKMDGTVFKTAGGAAKLAFGGQYRREGYDTRTTTYYQGDRKAQAVFAELFWPLIGADNKGALAQRLELSLAGRYEDYSDFGTTFDPKLGVLWSPINGLNLRGSIGTSFRAPLLWELRQNLTVQAVRFTDPLAGGALMPILFLQGSTGALMPEESTAWTVGFDFEPAALPELKVSMSYFDIDFEDRITTAIPSGAASTVLTRPDLYGITITRNPSLAEVNALFASPTFYNSTGILPQAIVAVIDNRTRNIASRTQQGVDLTINHGLDVGAGRLTTQLSGTYLFSIDEQLVPGTPINPVLNTVYYPVDLRLRGGIGWAAERWSANSFVNYTDGYRDIRPTALREVGSFTTLDLSVRYHGFTSPMLADTELSLNVINALDRAPPFIQNTGLNFDATNASALGRFMALQITHQW